MRKLHQKIKLQLGEWYGLSATIVVLFALFAVAVGVVNVLPLAAHLNVPFTSQAPAGDWREPWQNACEEASIIMIDTFYKDGSLTKETATKKILDIFSVKEERFGSSKDESMERVADIINAADLGWRATVVADPTLEALQAELVAGRPIIVPVDARRLENPYYEDGLAYHVMVLSGYDTASKTFIVQDPGTRRGQNFKYSFTELLDAISDYLPPHGIVDRKAVIFTAPRLAP